MPRQQTENNMFYILLYICRLLTWIIRVEEMALSQPRRGTIGRQGLREELRRGPQSNASTSSLMERTDSKQGLTEEFLRSRGVAWGNVRVAELGTGGRRALVASDAGIAAGEEVLRVPMREGLVSLSAVFGEDDDDVAEALTTSKLSELACLALLLMYEKVSRESSDWYPLISELDLARARGLEACETPVLWPEHERERLLQGSPLASLTRSRIAGIEREYKELDTVWWMNKSLYNSYPFDPPSEQFSVNTFIQAFCAVQSCCVHLRGEGVSLANRFAVVPLGPPLMVRVDLLPTT